LAACGAQVVLTSRRQEGAQEVADSIVDSGGKAVAMACHAGKLEEIEALFEFVSKEFGRLDILINNAATNPYYGPATGLSPRAFDKTVEVNLKGPYFMTSAAVPLMIQSGGGSVVNVASIAALIPLPGQAVYSMTKEYGQQGIRVNAILPGVVKTRFASALVEDPSIQKWLSRLPVPRAGQPEDMVAGVLYLVSDQAAYTTGTTLVMDGGASLG
jgi:NAD(P)-dependent dehydrogenase (short-subunit alcohol dehydrogenase family)